LSPFDFRAKAEQLEPAPQFQTNLGDIAVLAGPMLPIRIERARNREPRPYVRSRRKPCGLNDRKSFYAGRNWVQAPRGMVGYGSGGSFFCAIITVGPNWPD